MKSSKWLIWVVVAVVVVAVVFVVSRRPQTEEKDSAPPVTAVSEVEESQPAIPMEQPEAEEVSAGTSSEPAPEPEESRSVPAGMQPDAAPQEESDGSKPEPQRSPPEPLKSVDVQPDTALAKVNGVTLTLKDLIAVNPQESRNESMRDDAYTHLLNKAIEREVVFQAAEAQGLELNEAQQHELETIRDAAFERAGTPYVGAGYEAESQGEFEVRVRTAELLLDLLLNESGSPSQYVTPERVQEYYAEHQAEFDSLPEDPVARSQAWTLIETKIRDRLTSEVFIQHEQKRRQMLDTLKSEGTIEQFTVETGE